VQEHSDCEDEQIIDKEITCTEISGGVEATRRMESVSLLVVDPMNVTGLENDQPA